MRCSDQVAVGVVGIVVLLGVGLDEVVEGFLLLKGVELEQHIVLDGVGQIAAVLHLAHGVGRRGLAGLAPVDQILIDGNLRLDLDVGVEALAVQQRDQLGRVNIVAVAVLNRVLLKEVGVVALVLEVVARGRAFEHDLGAEVRQRLLVEDDEGIQRGAQHGQDVVVADAADVVAAHAGHLGGVVEQLGGALGADRAGEIVVVIRQIQLQRAGDIGLIRLVHRHALLGQHVRRALSTQRSTVSSPVRPCPPA